MYCLMSARSTNAKSIAPVMLDVVSIRQFGNLHQRNHANAKSITPVMLDVVSIRQFGNLHQRNHASFNTSGHYMTPQ